MGKGGTDLPSTQWVLDVQRASDAHWECSDNYKTSSPASSLIISIAERNFYNIVKKSSRS